jgi:cell division transport system permease protein
MIPMLHFSRLLRHAWQNVTRNAWLSLATAIVGVMTLLSVNILVSVNVLGDHTMADLRSRVNLVLYFKPDVASERVRDLGMSLEKHPSVSQVRFISPDVALERFKERHSSDVAVMESLAAVGGNPFGSSLVVLAKSERDYQPILATIGDEPYRSLLQQNDEEFRDYATIIQKFGSMAAKVRTFGLLVSGIFVFIAVLLVFNAIRVAMYTQRDEIGIMKLVGATNWYVKVPFLLAAAIYAVVSTVAFIALWYGLLWLVQPLVSSLWSASPVSLAGYFSTNFFKVFGLQLLGLIVLNVFSATIAIRRYARV